MKSLHSRHQNRRHFLCITDGDVLFLLSVINILDFFLKGWKFVNLMQEKFRTGFILRGVLMVVVLIAHVGSYASRKTTHDVGLVKILIPAMIVVEMLADRYVELMSPCLSFFNILGLFVLTGFMLRTILIISLINFLCLITILSLKDASGGKIYPAMDIFCFASFCAIGAAHWYVQQFLAYELFWCRRQPLLAIRHLPPEFFLEFEFRAFACLGPQIQQKTFTYDENLYIFLRVTHVRGLRETVLKLLNELPEDVSFLDDLAKLDRVCLRAALQQFRYRKETSCQPVHMRVASHRKRSRLSDDRSIWSDGSSMCTQENNRLLYGMSSFEMYSRRIKSGSLNLGAINRRLTANIQCPELNTTPRNRGSSRYNYARDTKYRNTAALSPPVSSDSCNRQPRRGKRKACIRTERRCEMHEPTEATVVHSSILKNKLLPPNEMEARENQQLEKYFYHPSILGRMYNEDSALHNLPLMRGTVVFFESKRGAANSIMLTSSTNIFSSEISSVAQCFLPVIKPLWSRMKAFEAAHKGSRWKNFPCLPKVNIAGHFVDRKMERWFLSWSTTLQARMYMYLAIPSFLCILFVNAALAAIHIESYLATQQPFFGSVHFSLLLSFRIFLHISSSSVLLLWQRQKYFKGTYNAHMFKLRATGLSILALLFTFCDCYIAVQAEGGQSIVLEAPLLTIAILPLISLPSTLVYTSTFISFFFIHIIVFVACFPMQTWTDVPYHALECIPIFVLHFFLFAKPLNTNLRLMFCEYVLPYLLYVDSIGPPNIDDLFSSFASATLVEDLTEDSGSYKSLSSTSSNSARMLKSFQQPSYASLR